MKSDLETASVPRKFEWEISTPAIKNRHKIATQKFLKIATFLAQIATFVSNNVGKWPPFLFLLHFYVTIFWKMWHFRRKSGILSWQNQIDGVFPKKHKNYWILCFKKNRHLKKTDRHLTLKIATVAINRHIWSHWFLMPSLQTENSWHKYRDLRLWILVTLAFKS